MWGEVSGSTGERGQSVSLFKLPRKKSDGSKDKMSSEIFCVYTRPILFSLQYYTRWCSFFFFSLPFIKIN